MLQSLAYYVHDLDPSIVEIGPLKWLWGLHLAPRWYGFAYLMGFLGAYLLMRKLARDGMLRLSPNKVSDLVLNSCIFGVLIGGRLGYVLFYDLPNALKAQATPLLWNFSGEFPYWGVLRVMDGGMSAHGGIIFSILALAYFSKRYGASLVNMLDASSMVVPIGLCLGRIANFINGELYGHPTAVSWAVKFPSEVYAPTNSWNEVAPDQVQAMKEAVGKYMGEHWQELTTQQVQDFLGNHPRMAQQCAEMYGSLSPANLETYKKWLGYTMGLSPDEMTRWDIARWWEHSRHVAGGFHQMLHGQFEAICHPRHPSQLYEALLEGVLLFTLVWLVGRLWKKDGMAGGAFAVGYPVMRILGEQFRVGDSPKQILGISMSLGVIYSVAMLVPGLLYWLYWIRKDRRVTWVPVAKEVRT